MADPAQLRQFINELFSDDELEDLCFDYFPEVLRDFTQGMTKGQKVRLLIGHAERRGRLEHLTTALAMLRPDAYADRFGDTPVEAPAPVPISQDAHKIFICHAYEDEAFAHRLAGDLRSEGWKVWIAPDSIRPGEKWVDAINVGLRASGVFLLVLTPAAVESRWVQDEIHYAIDQANQQRARLFVLDLEESNAPPLWTIRQHISFRKNYGEGLHRLRDALRSPEEESEQASPRNSRERTAEAEPASFEPERVRFWEKNPEIWIFGPLFILIMAVLIIAAIRANRQNSNEEQSGNSTQLSTTQSSGPGGAPISHRTVTLPGGLEVEQVHVPAGPFIMGSDAGETNEMPAHEVTLGGFWIDRTEVTNAQFGACVGDGKCEPLRNQSSFTRPVYFGLPEFENHPVVHVNWHDALAYCTWAGGRLPTEAEWEKAARGNEGFPNPWGEAAPSCERANVDGCFGDTKLVDDFAAGMSPYGALNMAGNVWEWVNDWYDEHYYDVSPAEAPTGPQDTGLKVWRGGGWTDDGVQQFATVRRGEAQDLFLFNLGFRCAYDE